MTERIRMPLAAKRLVYKAEELHRKREGTWDATTMVSVTSPEGAALLASQRASSPEKVAVAQPIIAVERLKNEMPPHEPTALPTSLTTTVENGTTKAELLPPANAAASEAEGPKTKSTPLGATGSKRRRSGGRQLKKQKLPAEVSKLGRRRSPELMRIFLDSLAEDAVLIHATKKAGIHRRTPEYWLKGSADGQPGYDVEWRGVTMKFHEHYTSAKDEGSDYEEIAVRMATGYDEILTYKGRVSYKIDLARWSLGHRGPDAYLKDENGDPVPETVRKFDPKMIRWVLARRDKRVKTDVTHKSGVLVVGVPSKSEVTVAQEIAVEQLKNETPPHEPTSLPTSLATKVENGTTKAELLPPDAATREAEGPKTESNPLRAIGSKRSRRGGRQLKKQKLPAEISELGRKRTHERMRIFLDSLAEDAVLIHATKKARIHRRTPENWLKGSAAGQPGYDVEWRGDTMKFHEHYISALEEGVDHVRAIAYRLATGYDEILTYQGRVSYKIDPDLWSLGQRGPDAYLRDENGNPVPETIHKSDPKMLRWVLDQYHPYDGSDSKLDVTQQSGVPVIGPPKTEKRKKEFSSEQQTQDVELNVDDDSEGEK